MGLTQLPSRIPSASGPLKGIGEVVEALTSGHGGLARSSSPGECRYKLPNRDIVARIVEDLRSVLFPGYFGGAQISAETLTFTLGSTLARVVPLLEEQIARGLTFACEDGSRTTEGHACDACGGQAAEVTRAFLAALPRIRDLLSLDVDAAFEGDPAASSPDEIIFCYPGIRAIANHRLAHEIHRLGVPLLPRMIAEMAHADTGIDIHPGASIGERFFIDHGTGVVIGETSIIGNGVRVYQGVTLGARSFVADGQGRLRKGLPRHPIVEDDVVIYAGATILGRVTLGRGCVIGGNLWITRSVPPNTVLTQVSARQDSFQHGAGI
jgi:serine O-acetyltransferase